MPRTKPSTAAAPTQQQVEIVIPELFPWQRQVLSAFQTHRYVVCVTAQQIGKTTFAAFICADTAMKGGDVWWVAPDYSLTEPGYDLFTEIFDKQPFVNFVEPYKQRKMFTFRNGGKVGTIQIKSADEPHKLRGKTLNLVVMDECAFMHPDAWHANLRHRLTVRRGKALLISNPFGKNWLWELWRRGDPDNPERDPDWASFQFSQYANPLIDPKEIEKAKASMPRRKFQREVMGEFVDDGGEVFVGVRKAATVVPGLPPLGVYNPDHEYVIGADTSGGRQDATVAIVLDVTAKAQVAMYRFFETDIDELTRSFVEMYGYWHAQRMVIEENASALYLPSQLRKHGLQIDAFNTNWKSKTPLIDAWSAAIETGQVQLLRDDTLIKEHEAYESETTENGIIRFNAPKGGHDDTVIASALAWKATMMEQEQVAQPLVFTPFQGLYGKEKPRTRRVYR